MAELRFLENTAGEGEGLSEAGVETFRDRPFWAVARETGQNSRDASNGAGPVRVRIEQVSISSDEFPSHARYLEAAQLCLAAARRQRNDKESAFFRHAIDVLGERTIRLLKISDKNTKGLEGPCVEGKPFHALLKATGVSAKENDTAGGSFGIGKSAVYAASDLQTAFYSTVYQDDAGAPRFLCQGKTRFRSFTDNGGVQRRSVGYWGDPAGYLPVEAKADAPDWLRREEIGTSIFAIGMRASPNWIDEMVASVTQNFFCAIHRGEMEFEVQERRIDRHTLPLVLSDPAIARAAAAAGFEEEFDFAEALYRCISGGESVLRKIDVRNVGAFNLQVLVREKMPRRIAILRNGMLITDNLQHFKDKFLKFPMYKDFVAALEPADDASSAWLRAMENPRHDDISPERLPTDLLRSAARSAGQRLAKEVRELVKGEAKPPSLEVSVLDELGEFFALDDDRRPVAEGERDLKTTIVSPPSPATPTPARAHANAAVTGDRGGGGQRSGGGNRGGGDGPQTGAADGGVGQKGARAPSIRDIRTILPDPDSAFHRTIYFTADRNGVATLRFEAEGVANPEMLSTRGGAVRVECEANRRTRVEVEFETAYAGPLVVTSQEKGGDDEGPQ